MSQTSAGALQLQQTIPVNRRLIHRQQLLARIEEVRRLPSNKTEPLVVLWGLGGMGKTTLGYAYALQQYKAASQSNHVAVVRIRAESEQEMEADFRELAHPLRLDVDGKTDKALARRVCSELVDRYKNGVIVFDNVSSYDDVFNAGKGEKAGMLLQSLWPKGDKFIKIVTTRNRSSWPPHTLVEVSNMTRTESINLLSEVSGVPLSKLQTPKVNSFVGDVLDQCPLAICQVASILKDRVEEDAMLDIDAFVAQCTSTSESKEVLEAEVRLSDLTCEGETAKYRRAIMTTYKMNLSFLQQKDPRFPRILEDAAFMAAESIRAHHLFTLAEQRASHCEPGQSIAAAIDQRKFQQSVGTTSLMQFAKLRVSTSASTRQLTLFASIHRIVQLVLRFGVCERGNAEVQVLLRALLQYFSQCAASDPNAFQQYDFLLRQIDAGTSIFNLLPATDATVLSGHISVAQSLLRRNPNPRLAVASLHRVLRHGSGIQVGARDQAETLLLDAFKQVEWAEIDTVWIAELVELLTTPSRNKAILFFSNQMKELSQRAKAGWKTHQIHAAETHHSMVSNLLAFIDVLLSSPSASVHHQSAEMALRSITRILRSGCTSLDKLLQEKNSHLSSIEATVAAQNGHTTPAQARAISGMPSQIADLKCEQGVLEQLEEEAAALCATHNIEVVSSAASASSSSSQNKRRRRN